MRYSCNDITLVKLRNSIGISMQFRRDVMSVWSTFVTYTTIIRLYTVRREIPKE